jgi:hypothetical protein
MDEHYPKFFSRECNRKGILPGSTEYLGDSTIIYPLEMDMADNDDEAPFDDQLQLEDYQRVFPIFWEYRSVAGITMVVKLKPWLMKP